MLLISRRYDRKRYFLKQKKNGSSTIIMILTKSLIQSFEMVKNIQKIFLSLRYFSVVK